MKSLDHERFRELSGYLTARQYVVCALVGGFYGPCPRTGSCPPAKSLTEAAEELVLDRGQLTRIYKDAMKVLRSAHRSSTAPFRPPSMVIYPGNLAECRDNLWLTSLLDHGIRRSDLKHLLEKIPHQLGQYATFRLTATARQAWLQCAWSRRPGIARATIEHLQAAKYPRFIKPKPWKVITPAIWDRRKRVRFCAIKRAAGQEWQPVLSGLGHVRATRALEEFNTLRLRLELIALKRGVSDKVIGVTRAVDSFLVEFDQAEPMLVLLQDV